jgi:hypothetical protein
MEFTGRVQKGSNPMLDTCDLKRSLWQLLEGLAKTRLHWDEIEGCSKNSREKNDILNVPEVVV